ncbi:phosphate ABC transporter substrate-binding protein, PhoT family [Pontibacter qinzhouensis]|uniref:Phosphate ABC transporter substrate-binding protein, PhoT family n=1 Tax=Pontibacter qinzhouensis TaxID=2603253 RepID=A0A5C8JGV8_9BACT|nr:substrate-binding domain-containing protein [Pontibacter qinzhouensis]TXK36642.1 phosphate ABC transporter substrate-binding protein, PhoT family [Pontibacter qinzhouensis]
MINLGIKKWAIGIATAIVLITTGCNNSDTPADTPTSGNITISIDESFQPIMDSQVYTFESIYKYAKLNPQYKSEGAVIQDLLRDSTRVAVLSRDLRPDEKAVFDQRKIIPRVVKIAIDAVALIVNKNNPDTLLTVAQVQDIFSGNITSWADLSPGNKINGLTIVFDNNNSSTARFVQDSIIANQALPSNTYASNSHEALIDYVSQNENTIGVIGVNWISDFDDTTAVRFMEKIKVVGVSTESSPATTDSYYQPYQAYIAQGTYPLRRYLYIISTEGRTGLGTGFASFIAGDKGQRIFLKSGLVPATMPVRVIGLRQ